MDALELLTQQHREAMDLFRRIEAAEEEPRRARELFLELQEALTLHEELEETHLYPEMKRDPAFREDTLEAYQEHHVMDVLLREIADLAPGSEVFMAKIKVLKENVEHHAEEEEEAKLFPEIRRAWDTARLREISQRMQETMAGRAKGRRAA